MKLPHSLCFAIIILAIIILKLRVLRSLFRVYRRPTFDRLFFYALYLIDMLILSSPN